MPDKNKFWGRFEDCDGREVKINGLKHRIRYQEFKAVYPYERIVVFVSAEPVNRNTKYYRETKRCLGDDWSIDVSSLEPQDLVDVMQQLGIEFLTL